MLHISIPMLYGTAENRVVDDNDTPDSFLLAPANMARPSSTTNIIIGKEEHKGISPKDRSWYIPLYKASLEGDWESAKKFLDQDKDAITASITALSMTALHVVVGTGRATHFVENLVKLMPPEALTLLDGLGNTALNVAAVVGNTEAVAILVNRCPDLLHIRNNRGWLPVHRAAVNAHRDTLLYLLSAHKQCHQSARSLQGQCGVELLVSVIDSGFFDVALELVHQYPDLATMMLENGDSALRAMARKVSAFPSGNCLQFWESFVYSCVPVELDNYPQSCNGGDLEKAIDTSQLLDSMYGSTWSQTLKAKLWEIAKLLVPKIKDIQSKKLIHCQALQLVKNLCKEIRSLNDTKACTSQFHKPILDAAKFGIHEVVEMIVDAFPDATFCRNDDGHYIFELAIINRSVNVFNLIYQMTEYRQYTTLLIDDAENNVLHLAARLAPPDKLNLVSGAALQMQSELQWFKEVEKFVIPTCKEKKNSRKETPKMLFTKEHKELVVEGEKWMKGTATSCTIAAALIATVVFAAAVTVPGGNSDRNGLPIFSSETAFVLFAISDLISLFTSSTSLLMFLSILTSRYAECDFLLVLPNRLIIGFVTLFISITTMVLAFSGALYLMFGRTNPWCLMGLALFACLPITSFASLQFPLLVEVIKTTYGPGIFGKQSDKPFY